ncbi:MAG: site-2 protease family protein, partial [Planctomycetes bacterium]|nr:site-2 protease family protein [Planctomycetota bacterium]
IYQPEEFKKVLAVAAEANDGFRFEIDRSGEPKEVFLGPEWCTALKDDLVLEQNLESPQVTIKTDGALDALNHPEISDGITITSINGIETKSFSKIREVVQDSSSELFEVQFKPSVDSGSSAICKVSVTAQPLRSYFSGFHFVYAREIRKLSLVNACIAGFDSAFYMVKTCYLTLSRIVTGDVAGKNLGGILAIGSTTYRVAEQGLIKLFFFLAILSINLGFLNILPIPVLDGGHIFFLLIEKIKGSPVSEKVMGYSQIVGLAFILALFVYVTYNDILRLIY